MPAAKGDVSTATSVVQIDNLITPSPKPDYEAEVIAPLHARQEQLRQAAEQEQKRLEQERLRAEEIARQSVQPVQVAQVTGDCSSWMNQAGITDPVNAAWLISRESGCNPNAVNASSGACGIGQQLPCGKWPHTWNDPVGAMQDMQAYVVSRYGSWANAVGFWQAHHWY